MSRLGIHSSADSRRARRLALGSACADVQDRAVGTALRHHATQSAAVEVVALEVVEHDLERAGGWGGHPLILATPYGATRCLHSRACFHATEGIT